jgi:hypothetical protein
MTPPFDSDFLKKNHAEYEAMMAPVRALQAQFDAATMLGAPPSVSALLNDPNMKAIAEMGRNLRQQVDFVLAQGPRLPDIEAMQEGARAFLAAEEKRRAAERDRMQESMEAHDRLMTSIARSSAAAEERIADKVAERLQPKFPVKAKPPIGFGKK